VTGIWLFAALGACVSLGHLIGRHRCRLRLTGRRGRSFGAVPPGPELLPGEPFCRRDNHRLPEWTERAERTPWGGMRLWIAEAKCSECGLPQSELRVVYPPESTISVGGPARGQGTDPGESQGVL
jgi:hypothetical protein